MESVVMTAVMIFSVFMAIGIFMVLPLLIAGFFRRFIQSETGHGSTGGSGPHWDLYRLY